MTEISADQPVQDKAEFWAAQAMRWHEKYLSVLAMEDDLHRYRIALTRIAEARKPVTYERLTIIARHALDGKDKP